MILVHLIIVKYDQFIILLPSFNSIPKTKIRFTSYNLQISDIYLNLHPRITNYSTSVPLPKSTPTNSSYPYQH